MATDPLSSRFGRYVGAGQWHDEAGESRPYRVEMRLDALDDGAVRQWFRHDFYEEGSVTEQALRLQPRVHGVYEVSLEGTTIAGQGYAAAEAFHHVLRVPGNLVEVTHVFHADGSARVYGSAEKNQEGRFVWWEESLTVTT